MKFYLIISFLICLSCSNSKNENENSNKILSKKVLEVNFSKAKVYSYSNLFTSVKYLPLETVSGHLVGDISKIISTNDRYFIKSGSKISVFDESGKFQFDIDEKGEAPGHYRGITDFLVDTTSQQIEILDNRSFKVYVYDWEGKYVKDWKHNILAASFAKIDANTYTFYCGNWINKDYPYQLLIYSKDKQKIIDSFLPIDERKAKYVNYLDTNNFNQYGADMLVTGSGDDTIYELQSNQLIPRYYLDFEQNKIPDSFYDKEYENVSYFDKAFVKNDYAGLFNVSFDENSVGLSVLVTKGDDKYLLIHSNKTGQDRLISAFEDDIFFNNYRKSVLKVQPFFHSSNAIIAVIESTNLVDQVDSLHKVMSSQQWKAFSLAHTETVKTVKNLTAASNPVLQIFRLKPF